MQFLALSRDRHEENLAVDEALLDEAENADRPREVLRLWEPAAPLVVVGRSSHVSREVHEEACRQRGIPILRRTERRSIDRHWPGLPDVCRGVELRTATGAASLDAAHSLVMETMLSAIAPLVPDVAGAASAI